MQHVFNSQQRPQDYCTDSDGKFCGKFPGAPSKCPFKNCGIPMPMKKHGYYCRCLITFGFSGEIKIRRYICGKCGRTVSMLPSFCLAWYTYGVEIIVSLMRQAVETGSINNAVKAYSAYFECITRRQVKQYLSRLKRNRVLIQYGFNQISPGIIKNDDSPGDIEWTRRILVGKRPILTPESNTKFHNTMGISYMSTRNRIA